MEKIKSIHECSLRILDEIGIRFFNKEALNIARDSGCRVAEDVVRFSPETVMDLVKKAPSEFVLNAKNPDFSCKIGGDATEYLAGYGAPQIMDYHGNVRPATAADYIRFVKLMEAHDRFHINGGIPVQPRELPADRATALLLSASLHHSRKGLFVPNASGDELKLVFDMLRTWFGTSFEENPYALSLINSLSPLQYDEHALENCIAYARHGQPLIISGSAIMGTTGVLSPAGSFAQANAETLAGIALTQMIRPGTPVLFGLMSSVSDMASGTASIGAPEKALATRWNARLARFYNLPCRAGGTDTDAQALNVQSGMEAMLSMGATIRSRTNLVIHSAGILAGYGAISFEKFIADLDAIEMLEVLEKDIEVNETTLAFDVMKEVGIGNEYLTHPHTFAHCRNTLWTPKVGVRRAIRKEDADEELKSRLDKALHRILESYAMPTDNEYQLQDVRMILKNNGVDYDNYFPTCHPYRTTS